MDKILIYTNKFEELKNLAKILNALRANNFEVAFATDNVELVRFLSINKQLVVRFGTYHADFYVSNTNLKGVDTITFKKLEGLL